MANKFTFRKQKAATGLAGVGYPYSSVYIKHNKMVVGIIHAPNWTSKENVWRVSFQVKKEGQDCFKNATLKKKFNSEQEARDFLTDEYTTLTAHLDLYPTEDERDD
jgi:hypothetical protein